MSNIVDARGLSCPQPVLLTLDKIKKVKNGEMTVWVDTDTSRENVSRAAESQGWQVKAVEDSDEGYKIVINKE